MAKKNQEFKRIQKEISEILWNEWDPIGVNETPEARDEYDSYIGTVYSLLRIKAPESLIHGYLFFVESALMGLPKPGSRIKQTILKLKQIDFNKE